MKNTTRFLVTGLMTCFCVTAQAKGSQAGGLPALAEIVASLQSQVTNLEQEVANLQGGGDPFSGSYHTAVFESSVYGCGQTSDPGPLLGSPAIIGYLQNQGISSTTTRSAVTTSDADGTTLHIPEYSLLSQEVRLSGLYEEDTRLEGNLTIDIGIDGALSFDAGPDVTVDGQMSSTGGSFTLIARGVFDEGQCKDAFTVMMVGSKIAE